jgi:hypothetical protein
MWSRIDGERYIHQKPQGYSGEVTREDNQTASEDESESEEDSGDDVSLKSEDLSVWVAELNSRKEVDQQKRARHMDEAISRILQMDEEAKVEESTEETAKEEETT